MTVHCHTNQYQCSYDLRWCQNIISNEQLFWVTLVPPINHAIVFFKIHNTGFFHYADVTYPFVNQVVVTDGRWVRFHVYQLNTLFLWKDNEANPLRNLLWSSPRMPLYDVIEDGRLKGFNDDVLKQLLKCLLVRPEERGIDMRPYIQQEAPSSDQKYMNEVGQPPFPHIKPGRFEYPRNAVYF